MANTKVDVAKMSELDSIAADDLRRIEREVAAEATASVGDFDAMGDEQAAAEAAEAAMTFHDAIAETEGIEAESEERLGE